MRYFRSLPVKIVLNHVLVAFVTSIIMSIALTLLLVWKSVDNEPVYYHNFSLVTLTMWQFGLPDGQPNPPQYPPGFSLIVTENKEVLFSSGSTKCRAGSKLADCHPELSGAINGLRNFQQDGQEWVEVVDTTIDKNLIISRYGPIPLNASLTFGDWVIDGIIPVALFYIAVFSIFSIPVALAFGWFSIRQIARRILKVARVSRQFAGGELGVRVNDYARDEVGEVARQFDDMAATLEHNMGTLTELAQRNAELAKKAEASATQAERLRLARDLHDDLAQKLFSLSAYASALPMVIEKEPNNCLSQSQLIANLAEEALLELRTVLIELRPPNITQHGLNEALQKLLENWGKTTGITVNSSIVLTGRPISDVVQDVLYRVTQEALHNVWKHAKARSVDFTLVEGTKQITLSITDAGSGFETANPANTGKFGLINMQERVRTLSGKFTIESTVGKGTTVYAVLPLVQEELVSYEH